MKLLFNKLSPLKIFLFILSHRKCPKCGNAKLGEHEGSFTLTESSFTRTCKCGTNVQSGWAFKNNKGLNNNG